MKTYMMSLDQGTTSTRAIIFDHSGRIVSQSQREHEQILPQAGWVEHNPQEIWDNTREVMGEALSRATLTRHDIAGLGSPTSAKQQLCGISPRENSSTTRLCGKTRERKT